MNEIDEEEIKISKEDINSSLKENYDYIQRIISLFYFKEFN